MQWGPLSLCGMPDADSKLVAACPTRHLLRHRMIPSDAAALVYQAALISFFCLVLMLMWLVCLGDFALQEDGQDPVNELCVIHFHIFSETEHFGKGACGNPLMDIVAAIISFCA